MAPRIDALEAQVDARILELEAMLTTSSTTTSTTTTTTTSTTTSTTTTPPPPGDEYQEGDNYTTTTTTPEPIAVPETPREALVEMRRIKERQIRDLRAHTNMLSGAGLTPLQLRRGTVTQETREYAARRIGPGFGPLPNALGIMSIASSSAAMLQQLQGVTEGDPCAAVNEFFGSILGGLNPFLDALQDLLAGAMDIMAIIGGVMSAMSNIKEILNREIYFLTSAMLRMANWAMAQLIDGLIKDPCLRHLMSNVAQPFVMDHLT